MRIALVADWLPTLGGAEQVLTNFHELWPKAPLHTTIAKHGKLEKLDNAEIHTSYLQRLFTVLGTHRVLLPLMPRVMEQIDLEGYDVILSSSHAVGKGIVPPSTATHICYCHTPMRYAWEMEEQYLQDFRIPFGVRTLIKNELKRLRRWDLTTAKRTDHFIANSSTVQERIQRIYGRESTVIYPPVGDDFFTEDLPTQPEGEYLLALGRHVPYKRFDLLIDAANKAGIPLKIAGSGPEEKRLRKRAGDTVEFLGFVPKEDLFGLMSNAKAFCMPQFEDAGVVPLEAQACGTPVLALGQGGALDTVLDGSTGVYFTEQTVESFLDAYSRLSLSTFDRNAIREHARQFCATRFKKKIREFVEEHA